MAKLLTSDLIQNYKVISVVQIIEKYWKGLMESYKKGKKDFHESDLLNLNCNKAKTKLN